MGLDFSNLLSQQAMIAILTMVAIAGTLFSLVVPLLEGDKLKSRMKSVALEREQMRARERARLADDKANARVSLRNKPKKNMQGSSTAEPQEPSVGQRDQAAAHPRRLSRRASALHLYSSRGS